MATLVKKSDYWVQAQSRLPEQYKDKPRFLAWLKSYIDEVQALENACYAVYSQGELQNIANPPTGDILAQYGRIVYQGADGLNDVGFLILVIARITARLSQGRFHDLVRLVRRFYQSNPPAVWVFDFAPASVAIIPQSPASISDPYILAREFILPAVAAGVAGSYIWSNSATTGTIIPASVHANGFSATVPCTTPDIVSGNYTGSVHFASFSAGPPPTLAGGGVLAGVINDLGGT